MELKLMARMLGVEETASEKQIEDKALALSGFLADVCAATGAKSPEEAIGKVRAGLVAIGERDGLKTALETQAAAGVQKEFRHELKAALKEGRITLGEVRAVIPTMMKDDEQKKVATAIAKLDAEPAADASKDKQKSYRDQLLDAVCAGQIGDKRLTSVRAFINARPAGSILPAAKAEPQSGSVVAQEAVSDKALAIDPKMKDFSAKYAMGADKVVAFVRCETVDEAIAARKQLTAQK